MLDEDQIRSLAREVAADFIANQRPGESILFPSIWDQLVSGRAFNQGPLTPATVRAHGLRSDAESPGFLATPFAILIVWAVLNEMKARDLMPDKKLVEAALRKCAADLGTPSGLVDEVVETCSSKLVALLQNPKRAIFSARPAEIAPGEFKSTPYIDLARNRVTDGKGGELVRGNFLQGAQKTVLTHLLNHNTIHAIEVIAFQASTSDGSVDSRRKHVESTIARVRLAVKVFPLEIKKLAGDRHGLQWTLDPSQAGRIGSSVQDAFELAKQAQSALNEGNARGATTMALKGIECDKGVQEVHEAYCCAILAAGPDASTIPKRLAESVRFLRRRLEQLDRGLKISAGSYEHMDDDDAKRMLENRARKFESERGRLNELITGVTGRWGPLDFESARDRAANQAIRTLREQRIVSKNALRDPISVPILVHPTVAFLKRKAVDWASARLSADYDYWHNVVAALVLQDAANPNKPANIRAICKGCWHKLFALVGSNATANERIGVEADARKCDNAMDLFRMEHGYSPSLENEEDARELSSLTGLPIEKLKQIREWKSLQAPRRLKPDGEEEPESSSHFSDEDGEFEDDEFDEGGFDEEDADE